MAYEQGISDIGTQFERDQALADARAMIRERGETVLIRLHKESTVERDSYNSIKKRTATSHTFYVFPLTFNPTAKQLEDAGIKESVDVMIKTAMLDWTDLGYTMKTLREIDSIRATVIIDGYKYELKTKQLDSQFQGTFLYIHLGLNRI